MPKDAYAKRFPTSKRNETMCGNHLAMALDAINLIMMGHDCVGGDGIGDEAKAGKLL